MGDRHDGIAPIPNQPIPRHMTEGENRRRCLDEARRFVKFVDMDSMRRTGSLDGEGYLGGHMLEQYLNGVPTAGMTGKLARAIAGSDVHQRVRNILIASIQARFDPSDYWSEENLRQFAQRVIDDYRRADPNTTYFQQDDHALQSAIGGLNNLKVGSVKTVRLAPTGQPQYSFMIELIYCDIYDFENDRSHNANYDGFRKLLADRLRAKEFDQFWTDYHRAWSEGYWFDKGWENWENGSAPPGRFGPLRKSHVVASFMYAIEKAGYTCGGIRWQTSVLVEGLFDKNYQAPPINLAQYDRYACIRGPRPQSFAPPRAPTPVRPMLNLQASRAVSPEQAEQLRRWFAGR